MRASILFKQYVWLVDTIRRSRRISLADINQRWQLSDLSDGIPLSRTTFNRHRAAVEDIFGITIACDADNRYYIASLPQLHSDSVQQWMLNTITVSNIVGEARGLHDRILLESIPCEGEMLRQVVESMQRSVCIEVRYRRYDACDEREWIVEPYCIKLFRRRWYLLCRFASGQGHSASESDRQPFFVLSFDRIINISLTDCSFALDPAFDAEDFFSEYFGVMTDERVPLTRLVLRAFGNERYALRDLPLHHSQRLLAEGDDYVDFELLLRPTSDFYAHLLSRGRWVKVIEPASIAQRISELHQEAVK